MSEEKKTIENQFIKLVRPEDVQSVSAGGVSLTLRDQSVAAKTNFELELQKQRALYNPLNQANWNDMNQRR